AGQPATQWPHTSSFAQLNQRQRSGACLHDSRRFDQDSIRRRRKICVVARPISCARFVARAQWRAILDVSLNMRRIPSELIRLKAFHRRLLYGVLALLFFTGAAWVYWNYLVPSSGDFEIGAKAWAMKLHGGAAMAILVLVGMLLTGHVRFAWRARR